MSSRPLLSPLTESDHDSVARLLHRSLVHWYGKRLNQGARFGDRWEPFRLFPEVYHALDPGEGIGARDPETGELLGVCFIHARETHVAVGIVVTSPEAGGRGVARQMFEVAVERAKAAGLPLRLVSSLLNLDSFSLYTRLGLVPHTMFQDLLFEVPAGGMTVPPPPGADQVRLAHPGEAAALADLEKELQGVRRQKDYEFFIANKAGDWRVWVLERSGGELAGVLVSSHHPDCGMMGPGVARDEAAAEALIWKALDARRGSAAVVLVPCLAAGLVRNLYQWGAKNIELHTAQILGPIPQTKGLTFPTFLPESA